MPGSRSTIPRCRHWPRGEAGCVNKRVSVEAVRPAAGLAIGRVRRTPARSFRPVLVSALVALGGLIVGEASLSLLPVRVTIDVAGTTATARIDGSQHTVTLS